MKKVLRTTIGSYVVDTPIEEGEEWQAEIARDLTNRMGASAEIVEVEDE